MLTDDPPPPSCALAPEGGSAVQLVTLDPWCSCLSRRECGWTVRGNLSAGRASRAGARGCVCPAHLSGPCSPSPCLRDTVGFARGLWGPAPFVDFLFCFVLLLAACFRCSFLKYTWDGSERTWCDVSARHPEVHCTRVGAETSSCRSFGMLQCCLNQKCFPWSGTSRAFYGFCAASSFSFFLLFRFGRGIYFIS